MKYTMKQNVFWRLTALVVFLSAFVMPAVAQGDDWEPAPVTTEWDDDSWDQEEACPGWYNPTSFSSGPYSGKGGTFSSNNKPCPNVLTANIGWNPSSNYTASQLDAGSVSGVNTGSCTNGIPNSNLNYYINHPTNPNSATDPNTGNHLKYVPVMYNNPTGLPVPTTFTKSIRIGDGCYNGSSSNNNGASLLDYEMEVTPDNAMMYIYYAIVAQAPGHGFRGNPTFVIRVMKGGQQLGDTLAYYISSTPVDDSLTEDTQAGFPVPCPNNTCVHVGQEGWAVEGSGYSQVYYKDWSKVALNLASCMYSNVHIQVAISDCYYHAHYAYAYIAGECRPLSILSSGCPPGADTVVTTLTAPRGMQKYVWYASKQGHSPQETYMYADDDLPFSTKYYTFRRISSTDRETEAQEGYIYKVKASDFTITHLPNTAHNPNLRITDEDGNPTESVDNIQTFRCEMTSALNPRKPFRSNLYVTVTNTKPTMKVDTLSLCGGDVVMVNKSFVPGNQDKVIPDSMTVWSFYSTPDCSGQPDTVMLGDTAIMHYMDTNTRSLRVRTHVRKVSLPADNLPPANPNPENPDECYSSKDFLIHPLPNPTARMSVSKTVLCGDETTTLKNTSQNITYHRWNWLPETAAEGDSLSEESFLDEVTRSFTHDVEPITLTVRNGLYRLDTVPTRDTIWCEDTARTIVSVFNNPRLKVVGDTIVCAGDVTDVFVYDTVVDSCTYKWYSQPNGGGEKLSDDSTLHVAPTSPVTTYYVVVRSPRGCSAEGNIRIHLVTPTLSMTPSDGRICWGQTVHLFSGNAHHYTWKATPPDPSLANVDTMATSIEVSPSVTTVYTMWGHGANNCTADSLTKTVVIVPRPLPDFEATPGIVDVDDPTVVLRDVSTYSVGSRWVFEDGTQEEGTQVSHTFDESAGNDSVYFILYPRNELECDTMKRFGIPVNLYTAWLPTAFTPGSEDDNARFRLYTINDYEYFHIYIYNRRGELVFESADPTFEWDGICDGREMPQGSYVYVCRYRKPGMYTLSELNGTVTLIR